MYPGTFVQLSELGIPDGSGLGSLKGIDEGNEDGSELGISEGIELGSLEGIDDGVLDGSELGISDGIELGRSEERRVGKDTV